MCHGYPRFAEAGHRVGHGARRETQSGRPPNLPADLHVLLATAGQGFRKALTHKGRFTGLTKVQPQDSRKTTG